MFAKFLITKTEYQFVKTVYSVVLFLSDSVWKSEEYPELGSRLYQGDILMPHSGDGRNAIKLEQFKWPDGIVPYSFNKEFSK